MAKTRRKRQDLSTLQDMILKGKLIDLARDMAPITVRGLYYQSVLHPLLPFITKDSDGDKHNYDLIQGRVTNLRRDGTIPWEWIVDESRASYKRDRYANVSDFASIAPYYYGLDYWDDQRYRPLVIVEKNGQVGVYRDHASSFGVDIASTKGYGSISHIRRIVEESILPYLEKAQDVYLLIAADFDPSGNHWPVSMIDEIKSMLPRHLPGSLLDSRVLLNYADALTLGSSVALRLPNPNDSRTKAFCHEYGLSPMSAVCTEMDAMAPTLARGRMEEIFTTLFDGDIEDKRQEEAEHRVIIRDKLAGL